jgi:hypothetical protein
MRNPSLSEQPRRKPAPVISTKQQVSILAWLRESNRLIARETNIGFDYKDESEELDALVVGDNNYEEDDDDDDDDDDEVED